MKVSRETDNNFYTTVLVEPWPDEPFAANVMVIFERRDMETGKDLNRAKVRYGQHPVLPGTAYAFAQAILRAVDIARQLEAEGDVRLEGEE